QGTSLPWSGTRAATVRRVSTSACEGPGSSSQRAGTERRCWRRERLSFIGTSSGLNRVKHRNPPRKATVPEGKGLPFSRHLAAYERHSILKGPLPRGSGRDV